MAVSKSILLLIVLAVSLSMVTAQFGGIGFGDFGFGFGGKPFKGKPFGGLGGNKLGLGGLGGKPGKPGGLGGLGGGLFDLYRTQHPVYQPDGFYTYNVPIPQQ